MKQGEIWNLSEDVLNVMIPHKKKNVAPALYVKISPEHEFLKMPNVLRW